ncbi:Hsp20/alpha crystallin family protein [Phyllobacterium myrsinacearum]|uniref:HSP20 family protein n=1 Tax=Phyllobacterium myrsinacearum TaxID=28101 RepID=A0A839EV96_9HYPH|nr:Hsp20/alpha crystallin family protein [Phyllobacterium myrsinacearum]MBA8882078.1 HSP20 family protein [Phyllobacterium myrsinacearum]
MNVNRVIPSQVDHTGRKPLSFKRLRKEINKMFDDFSHGMLSGDHSLGLGTDVHMTLELDVQDHKKHVSISVGLPGVDDKDIDVSISGKSVTISGEKKSRSEGRNGESFITERSFGAFSRSVSLPFDINADKVEAKFSKGVLEIEVEKPQELLHQSKKVPIKG